MPRVVADVAAFLVALVLAVSAGGKLWARDRVPADLIAFGVPSALAPALSWVLPIVEVGVTVTLLVPATRTAGAIVAVVMLSVFTGGVAANLLWGRRPPCACFGGGQGRPISGVTLVRNAVLVALAVLATG